MKVFGVGLSRTGTTSLTEALRALGYRATHNRLSTLAHDKEACRLTVRTETIARFDAATGIAIARFYPTLDVAFPKAKFILTTRDTESWLASMERNRWSHELVNRIPRMHAAFVHAYGTGSFDDTSALTQGFVEHEHAVRAYFAERPGDLLVLDMRCDDHWQKLCRFLGRPDALDGSFPWLNRRIRSSKRNLIDFVLP